MNAGNTFIRMRRGGARVRAAAFTLAILACAGAARGQDSVEALIAAIRQSQDIRAAASLYAKARAIDSKNVEVCRSYMRTALRHGFPRIAQYAAAEMIQLDSSDGTAWSVQCYQSAVRQDYRQAISAGVRASEMLENNASVLNNMGYLMAWYDAAPNPPRLGDSTSQSLAVQKPRWLKSAVFTKCYNETVGVLKAHNERVEQCKEKALKARRQLDTLTGLAKKLRSAASSHASVIDACDARIQSLQAALDHTRIDPTLTDTVRNAQVRSIENQMRLLTDRRNRWNGYFVQATNRMQSLGNEIRAATVASEEADRRLKDAEVDVFKPAWRPPDVDGVMTADAEPDGPTNVSALPPAAQAHQITSGTLEGLLDMAKLLIRNGMEEKGKESLKAIISRHPTSRAAKEAQAVLDNPLIAYETRPPRPPQTSDQRPTAPEPPEETPKPEVAAAGPLKAQPAPGTAKAVDPEELLQAARLLVRNNQAHAAQALLQTIVREHTGTPAAREAKVLLAGLK